MARTHLTAACLGGLSVALFYAAVALADARSVSVLVDPLVVGWLAVAMLVGTLGFPVLWVLITRAAIRGPALRAGAFAALSGLSAFALSALPTLGVEQASATAPEHLLAFAAGATGACAFAWAIRRRSGHSL